MKYSVYTLADPRNGTIRYVGITRDVSQRYYYHCLPGDTTSNAYEWLKELRDKEIKPILSIIEEVDSWDAAYKSETYWMNFLLAEEEPLLNYIAPVRRRKEGTNHDNPS